MSMRGASPPQVASDWTWRDNSIALADEGALIHVHEGMALLFDGRLAAASDIRAVTLVIIEAYRRWGIDFPRHIDGDFALALWDSCNRRLVLARDVAGTRPLHYWVRGDRFRFAGEARQLLHYGDIAIAANERKISQWLCMMPGESGTTFFRDIWSVPAGHCVVWERGRHSVHDFWRPLEIPELRLSDPREYAEGLRSVLEMAVSERIGDLSAVGSHLSGGLDSSSVTATAARALGGRGGRVTAFTSVPAIPWNDDGFPGSFCDESSHAGATAALYPNIEHVLIPTISGSLLETLDSMSSASECPQLNPGNSCWFHGICAAAVSRGLRVVLTGANGNYTISWDGRRALTNLLVRGRVPEFLRLSRDLRGGRKSWPAIVTVALRPLLPSEVRQTLDRISGANKVRIQDATGLRPEFATAFGLDPQEALETGEMRDARALRVWSIRRHDFGGHLNALRRLTGVEQMDPTSDRRVMEFCLSVPEERYCESGRRRALIKNAMSGMLPPKVLEERRKGRQSADIVFHVTREKAEIGAELQRLKKIDLAARALDLPMLDKLLESWPSPPYGRQEHSTYGTRLMRAISMGRFIRRLEEGTLFKDQFAEGTRLAASTTSV